MVLAIDLALLIILLTWLLLSIYVKWVNKSKFMRAVNAFMVPFKLHINKHKGLDYCQINKIINSVEIQYPDVVIQNRRENGCNKIIISGSLYTFVIQVRKDKISFCALYKTKYYLSNSMYYN